MTCGLPSVPQPAPVRGKTSKVLCLDLHDPDQRALQLVCRARLMGMARR